MVVLGINPGPDPLEIIEVFIDAFQITFPILPDDHTVHDQYRQPGPQSPFPLDYVIDQDGNVAYHATEYQPDIMVAVIEDLLAIGTAVGELPAPTADPRLTAAPNPFNPRTVVSFELQRSGEVTLEVLDARGRRVRRLLAGTTYPSGRHELTYDGRDQAGRDLATGVYLLRLRIDGADTTRKLTLVR